MNIRRGWILSAAVLGFGAWVTTPAPAGTNDTGYAHLATSCVMNETSWGQMVVAQTTWRIWSDRESPDGYRWRARLIPHRPGLNFYRPWNEVEAEVENVGSTGASSYDGTVRTPPMGSDLDWDLQVKLTWDRGGERDLYVERTLDFDERACLPG
jgi:hypothetical protein